MQRYKSTIRVTQNSIVETRVVERDRFATLDHVHVRAKHGLEGLPANHTVMATQLVDFKGVEEAFVCCHVIIVTVSLGIHTDQMTPART